AQPAVFGDGGGRCIAFVNLELHPGNRVAIEECGKMTRAFTGAVAENCDGLHCVLCACLKEGFHCIPRIHCQVPICRAWRRSARSGCDNALLLARLSGRVKSSTCISSPCR